MPKTFYKNETDLPADQKGAYSLSDGALGHGYYLTALESDHPYIVANTEYKTRTEAKVKLLETQVTDLTNKKTLAESKSLPDGKMAVDPEIAELGETAKAAGLKKTEIPTLKTAADEAQKKITNFEHAQTRAEALVAGGFDEEKFNALLGDRALELEVETEKVDGKDVKVYYAIGDDNGKKTKTKFTDFVDKDPVFSKFKDVLVKDPNAQEQRKDGINYVQQNRSKETKPGDAGSMVDQMLANKYRAPGAVEKPAGAATT